ncbi:hypothetical protein ABH926_003015 [Catenulispora sp. GP43]
MSSTTEALANIPEQKSAAGVAQNLPTDPAAAPGRVITAATDQQAAALGLAIRAEARWPESAHDDTAPSLPGFIVSSFNPIAAETASRCLSRRSAPQTTGPEVPETFEAAETFAAPVTAVLITTARGDRESAAHVARTVATGGLLGPLLFFQSVPNAVAGHIAARWNLTGPVVCLADPGSALESAALLIEDGDADEALLVRIEQGTGGHDQAHAVLLAARASQSPATPVLTAPKAPKAPGGRA